MTTPPTVPSLGVAFSVEVPGTPEPVGAPISAATDASAWSRPTDVDEREGEGKAGVVRVVRGALGAGEHGRPSGDHLLLSLTRVPGRRGLVSDDAPAFVPRAAPGRTARRDGPAVTIPS